MDDDSDDESDGGDDEGSDLEGEVDESDAQSDGGDEGEGEDGAGDDESAGGEATEAEQDADQAADRAQLEVRYRDLRRNISLWDQRFQAENGRPPRSIDQPFHIEQQRAEYQSIKAQLGLGCVHAGASSETA